MDNPLGTRTKMIRPVHGRTSAETVVLHAAMRVVEGDPERHPDLTAAVNALHRERAQVVNADEFNARMLAMAPDGRAVNVLRRSGYNVEELLFTMTFFDVMDIRNAGMRTAVIWYLTCLEFGIDPPWAPVLGEQHWFAEQLAHERARLHDAGITLVGGR